MRKLDSFDKKCLLGIAVGIAAVVISVSLRYGMRRDCEDLRCPEGHISLWVESHCVCLLEAK
jgi:hypothetical protein